VACRGEREGMRIKNKEREKKKDQENKELHRDWKKSFHS
jgi:hypothetical protein